MMGHSVRRSSEHRSLARFRPRLETLERRVLLAADLPLAAVLPLAADPGLGEVALTSVLADEPVSPAISADAALLAAFESSYDNVTILQRDRLYENNRLVAEIAIIAGPAEPLDQPPLSVRITSVHAGRLVAHTQAFGEAGSPTAPADNPVAEAKPDGFLSTMSLGSRTQARPPGQSVASRYTLHRNEDSLDFAARQLTQVELLDPEVEDGPAPAADLDGVAAEVSQMPEAVDGFADDDAEHPWSESELPPPWARDLQPIDAMTPLFQSAACSVPSLVVASVIVSQSSEYGEGLDAFQAYRTPSPSGETGGQDDRFQTATPRWLSQVMVQVTKAGRASQLPLQEWIDVVVGNPIDRLSMLNGFDIFQELQLDGRAEADEADDGPQTGTLAALMPWSVLVMGLSASGMVLLRSHRPRRRRVAHDRIFANETLLAETLGP